MSWRRRWREKRAFSCPFPFRINLMQSASNSGTAHYRRALSRMSMMNTRFGRIDRRRFGLLGLFRWLRPLCRDLGNLLSRLPAATTCSCRRAVSDGGWYRLWSMCTWPVYEVERRNCSAMRPFDNRSPGVRLRLCRGTAVSASALRLRVDSRYLGRWNL